MLYNCNKICIIALSFLSKWVDYINLTDDLVTWNHDVCVVDPQGHDSPGDTDISLSDDFDGSEHVWTSITNFCSN